MPPAAFAAALASLGWSKREVARRLGCDVVLPIRWATGRARVPAPVALWLAVLAACQARHPAPADWRVR